VKIVELHARSFRTAGKVTRDELDQKKALDGELEKKIEAGIKAFKSGFKVK
jgi:hypothetical protein